jgi:DNA-binding NarL/FixJ family response regulator
VLADDDARFREYLRTLLTKEPSADVVGEAEDGEGALELVEALSPELLLVDLAMPGMNGIETTRRALFVRPRLEVIVITLHDDRRMVDAALEAGASGYVLKDHLDEELSDALTAVGRGDTFLSVGLAAARSHQNPPAPRVRDRPESS